MNKHLYTTILSFFVSTFSYSQVIELQKGDTIHKEIKITFNEEAVRGNEFLIFEVNDDFNFENLTLLINSRETIETTFKIYATRTDVIVPIDFFINESASSGKYNFSTKLVKSSNGLNGNINYKGIGELPLTEYRLSKPNWIKFLIYGGIGFILILLLLFIHKKSITFSRGNIHISEPVSQNYKLKGKTKFDSTKEGCCTDTGISFVLKKGKDGKLKITNKSKDTILYINNKIESTGKLINKNYTVKLVKGNKNITFKYI